MTALRRPRSNRCWGLFLGSVPRQGQREETALCRDPWEPSVHLGPVECQARVGMPHWEGVQGLDRGAEEQLSQDPGEGTQAFQEQGKMQAVRR